jgi:PGM1 C-terminal domain
MLGGRHGQTYLGCRFPADPGYAEEIAVAGLKVGRRLAREGVIGRAAVDFVSVRDGDGEWRNYAVEINLRCGGTTHPLLALTALTDGRYDALASEYRTRHGAIKHYVAADNLGSPAYQSLTPDDLLDIVEEQGLGWDSEREAGIVLHMVSALAAAGRVGLTAIGDTAADASARYEAFKAALDEAAGA